MPTQFHIEHEFRAPSMARFWESYFDPAHRARLDAATGLASREVLEREDRGDTLLIVQRVKPQRELPAFVRTVTRGTLEYIERQLFTRSDDRVDIEIQPQMFTARSHLAMVYQVRELAPGRLLRTCDGEIDIRVPLIGGRIERGVRDDLMRSYDKGVPLTQEWLDNHPL